METRKKRIFVVEDNLENRVITRYALTPLNVIIQFDAFGRDITRRVHDFEPVDLIILDLMLKNGASGYHVFKELRADETLKQVPIVAVSAADASEAMRMCRSLGFQGFIAKPIAEELFAQQIQRLLDGQQVWDAGTPMFR